MSSPFLYSPNSYQPTPYLYPYYNQPHVSPFIPPATLFPSSPRSPVTPYLPAEQPTTPTTPNTPRRVHFEDEYWARPQTRPRRPSWAGTTPAMSSVPIPQAVPLLQTPTAPFQNRRHSWGNQMQQPLWSSYTPQQQPVPFLYTPQTPEFMIHPLLNGESPRPDFAFDLSSPTFRPVRYIGPGQPVAISLAEMREPATHPPITRMRIICDYIPQWPIELEYTPYDVHGEHLSMPSINGAIPPVSLGDVLFAIHRALHQQITHLDWGRLTLSEEIAIARAYTRRCRSIPSVAQLEASQGVKKVDFLLDRFIFRGLIRAPGVDGYDEWKLIV